MSERKYGVVLYTNGDREIVDLALDLGKQINEIVGGYFETITLRTDKGEFDMWLNEEGKLDGLPFNAYATELFHMYFRNADVIVGNVLLTSGVDQDGNTLGLTQEEAELFYPNKKEN